MQKRWVIKKQADDSQAEELSQKLNINKILARLLIQRGIDSCEKAEKFFSPSLDDLHDPFLMKDMDKAVERIKVAISKKEKILVYGDYDVDGTTAVALVYSFLKEIHPEIGFYVPDRYEEGYGISEKGVEFAHKNNYSLVIALDCGIKEKERVNDAKRHNIDFIICDHHVPEKETPEAVAVLDPQREECAYPYKELTGCGIGFKLIQAYSVKNNIPFNKLTQYLDLVALSIASDIVSITGENRTLAYHGLKLINAKPRTGIEAILNCCGVKKQKNSLYGEHIFTRELVIRDLVFLVGPRINAAGRIENADASVKLLITKDKKEAGELSRYIEEHNTTRKTIDTDITSQAVEMIEHDAGRKNRKSTVVYNPDWHKGVLGIVASRLTEVLYRPTVVLTLYNGVVTGSARSVRDFDLYKAVCACSDLLEHFGGHKHAAGLSMKPENLEKFKQKFEEVVSSTITEEALIPEIEIDTEINIEDITSEFYNRLKQFAPFGPGNMAPLFKTGNVADKGYARVVGEDHLKLSIVQPRVSPKTFESIAFRQAYNLSKVTNGQLFDICYHIEMNEWNDVKALQLNIKEIC